MMLLRCACSMLAQIDLLHGSSQCIGSGLLLQQVLLRGLVLMLLLTHQRWGGRLGQRGRGVQGAVQLRQGCRQAGLLNQLARTARVVKK